MEQEQHQTGLSVLGKDHIKVLFIRPPYHLWPIINESDNFLMPLSFPCLSAYLKQRMNGIEVVVYDCLPLKIGYKTLFEMIKFEQPDVVGVGDSLPYIHEGLKVLSLAKEFNPHLITIAGGHFHSHLPRYTMSHYKQVDFIVRYEGEQVLVDLLEALRSGQNLALVPSIVYRQGSDIIETEPGPVIESLDTLPLPDYDIMPIHKYSPFGKLWPRAITIQGNRGCPHFCSYCSWTALEGEHKMDKGEMRLIPRLRAKSVSKVLAEIDVLYYKYGIRYLFWVDGTWNIDTKWLDELCSAIISKGYKLGWWAFVRADMLLEQEKCGVLEKMVRAGFRHALFGGERHSEQDMKLIGKTGLNGAELLQACHILKQKYPQVFRQSTFVTGIRTETKQSLQQLGAYSRSAHIDFAAYHPLMPYPGTPLWDEAQKKGWIEEHDFSKYDMFHPVMPSETLSREEISTGTQALYQAFIMKQPWPYLRGLFSAFQIRRRLHWWFLFAVSRVLLRDMVLSLLGRKQFEGFAAINKLWKPSWYDS
ncbi:B12-binding domain-containing radical SAM protein [candidate division CSSED10-310 bacterium]|uniref:B12-binding domain-containing radical SAM protein n=1 Tax=candidate division CSSED10-310 bacterium TaxID=2855610 RepID=A0ABV6Z4H9_UNCC1